MYVYLSPHHDDVCFSLGHLASRQGGVVVNLFTRSTYVAADIPLPVEPPARIEAITALRRGEDEQFVRAAGLTRRDLGLAEPRVIGRTPFGLADLGGEVDALAVVLKPVISELLAASSAAEPLCLFCPMGIGGHRNHLSTLLFLRRACDSLRRRCVLFLYEDLHYASVGPQRAAGLERARRLFDGYRLSPAMVRLTPEDAARKMELVGLYASQHALTPRARDYIPASGAEAGLHEMIWRVSSARSAPA